MRITVGLVTTLMIILVKVASEAERSTGDARLFGAANIIMKAAVKLPPHIIPIVNDISMESNIKSLKNAPFSNRRSFRLFSKLGKPWHNSALFKKRRNRKKRKRYPFQSFTRAPVTPYPFVKASSIPLPSNKNVLAVGYRFTNAPVLDMEERPVLTPDLVNKENDSAIQEVDDPLFYNQDLTFNSLDNSDERKVCLCCPWDDIFLQNSRRRNTKAKISLDGVDCSNFSPLEIKFQIQEPNDQIVKRDTNKIPSSESDYYILNEISKFSMQTPRHRHPTNTYESFSYLPRAPLNFIRKNHVPTWSLSKHDTNSFRPSFDPINYLKENQLRKAQLLAKHLLRTAIQEEKTRPYGHYY